MYYIYQVLPGSVMGRLMVRLLSRIAQHNLWRTGAKFKEGPCEELALSNPEDVPARRDLMIRGGCAQERWEFLALLRAMLVDIHRSFNDHLGVANSCPYRVMRAYSSVTRSYFSAKSKVTKLTWSSTTVV